MLPEEGRDIHPRSAEMQTGSASQASSAGHVQHLGAREARQSPDCASPRRPPQLSVQAWCCSGSAGSGGGRRTQPRAVARVRSGLVRLDELASPGAGAPQFVRLAVAGDLIGLEQGGVHRPGGRRPSPDNVWRPLAPSQRRAWPGSRWWLSQMQQRERRCVEDLRLRSGEAPLRHAGFGLLSGASARRTGPDALPQVLPMPSLQHRPSDVLGIRPESVAAWRPSSSETGGLQRLSRHRVSGLAGLASLSRAQTGAMTCRYACRALLSRMAWTV